MHISPVCTQRSATSRRRRTHACAALVAATVGIAACGSDSSDALPESVEVGAIDYAFTDLPERISTDTALTLRNDSDEEVHEIVAFAVPEGLEGTAEELLAMPEDELPESMDDTPAVVIIAGPGEESFVAVGDGKLSTPGRYLLLCGIPTGTDPDEYFAAATSDGPPEVDGGPPHFTNGMAATIEVVEAS